MEDLLSGSGEALGNSINQAISFASGTLTTSSTTTPATSTSSTITKQLSPQPIRRCPSPGGSPKKSNPIPSTSTNARREQSKSDTLLNVPYNPDLHNTSVLEVNLINFIYLDYINNLYVISIFLGFIK